MNIIVTYLKDADGHKSVNMLKLACGIHILFLGIDAFRKSMVLWMRKEWGIAPDPYSGSATLICVFWVQAFPFRTPHYPHLYKDMSD